MTELDATPPIQPTEFEGEALVATSGDSEPKPTWYERRGWRFGSMKLHTTVSLVYLFVALFPLVHFVQNGFKPPSWPRDYPVLLFFWAAFVALAYPLWAWQEARVFEAWVRNLPEQQRKAERAYFALQASLAKNFWAAVLAIYTVAGLIGIALK